MAKKIVEKKIKSVLTDAGIELNGNDPWDIRVHDKSLYSDIALKGSLGFGDAYVDGKWDTEKLDLFFEKVLKKIGRAPSIASISLALRDSIINSQAGRRAFHVGRKHYDLGNDMYEYMLGESMGYSSGMYLKDSDSLADAQYNKFDALCKKLDLKPGMKVLEIGGGWGTFARHAAKNYGVEVVGLTVSKEQKKYAEDRCAGLPVEFLLVDYKNLDEKFKGYFDRVVSIEMIEAVGKKNFRSYFEIVEKALKDNGRLGLQAIIGTGKSNIFISTRIFPNGLVPSAEQIAKSIYGLLSINSWDSFGKDYDRTLMAWDNNFVKNWKNISQLTTETGEKIYDEKFFRLWRFYLSICAASFRTGRNDVAQIVMTKQANTSKI